MVKFLLYKSRNGEISLTEHSPHAWECLKELMCMDNGMSFDEVVMDSGPDVIYGSFEYSDAAYLLVDDGGEIRTLWLTEVDRSGLVK